MQASIPIICLSYTLVGCGHLRAERESQAARQAEALAASQQAEVDAREHAMASLSHQRRHQSIVFLEEILGIVQSQADCERVQE